MLMSMRYKCLFGISMMFTLLFTVPLYAQDTKRNERPNKATEPPTKMTDEQLVKLDIGNFRMYLELILKKNILEELTKQESKCRLIKLDSWSHNLPSKTLVVEYSETNNDNRKICIRLEQDFIVIWYHNSSSLVKGKSTPLNAVIDTINDILGEAFVIGQVDTKTDANSGSSTSKSELEKLPLSKEVSDSNAISFRYGPGNLNKNHNDWKLLINAVSVLVKDNDAIIVMEKFKPRQALTPYIYEGFLASKTRLSKEDAEKVKDKPILARNVIFDEKNDTKDISDRLLNGCMWPIDDKTLVGAKDVGPASQLRPESMYNEKRKADDANIAK
jgi:hypothetical protein